MAVAERSWCEPVLHLDLEAEWLEGPLVRLQLPMGLAPLLFSVLFSVVCAITDWGGCLSLALLRQKPRGLVLRCPQGM